MSKNIIGLETAKTAKLAEKLNQLLSNYQILYMNVRAYHWNLTGDSFFTMHPKFEEVYDQLLQQIDEIAERVLTLGFVPVHAYSEYIKTSRISEQTDVSEVTACVQGLLDGYKILIELQRELLDLAGDANDEGTLSLMSDYITEQEKSVWMFAAFLK